jgi:hypothetical protein
VVIATDPHGRVLSFLVASYESKLSENSRIRTNNPNSSNTMDARRLHMGVSRAYTRARIQCALSLRFSSAAIDKCVLHTLVHKHITRQMKEAV